MSAGSVPIVNVPPASRAIPAGGGPAAGPDAVSMAPSASHLQLVAVGGIMAVAHWSSPWQTARRRLL